jgi:hypothetical protein
MGSIFWFLLVLHTVPNKIYILVRNRDNVASNMKTAPSVGLYE